MLRSTPKGHLLAGGANAPLSANYSMYLPKVATTLDSLAESFRKNSKLANLFDAISNGNARELLTYVYDMLTSTHLDTSKILEKIEETGRYIMPDHEALKAILFGNFMHYDPERSICINLYDIQKADPMEHFTRLLALHHAVSVPDTAPAFGHVALSDLVRYLCQLGYSEEHARYTAKHLYEKKCYYPGTEEAHTNPTRQRGECLRALAGASG